MKRVLAILFFVPFVMALAPPCHAAGYGEIAISLVDVPAELQERSVLVTLGSGPNDTDAVLVVLNGLNQYGQAVTLPEGIYYCNAAVQYDALNDWPLREVDGTTFLQVEAGGQYELQYEFAGESWFTEVTGQTRYYTPQPLRQPPANNGPGQLIPDGTSRLFSTLYRLPAEPVQRYSIRAGCIRIQSAGRRLHGG